MHYDFQWINSYFKICIDKASEDEAGEALAQAAPGGCGMASHEGPQHLPGQSPEQCAPNSMFFLLWSKGPPDLSYKFCDYFITCGQDSHNS